MKDDDTTQYTVHYTVRTLTCLLKLYHLNEEICLSSFRQMDLWILYVAKSNCPSPCALRRYECQEKNDEIASKLLFQRFRLSNSTNSFLPHFPTCTKENVPGNQAKTIIMQRHDIDCIRHCEIDSTFSENNWLDALGLCSVQSSIHCWPRTNFNRFFIDCVGIYLCAH